MNVENILNGCEIKNTDYMTKINNNFLESKPQKAEEVRIFRENLTQENKNKLEKNRLNKELQRLIESKSYINKKINTIKSGLKILKNK